MMSMSVPRALAGGDAVEHHGGGVRALSVLDDAAVRALGPDGELLRRRGAEGVRRRQQDVFALGGVSGRQLADGRGLAHAVHAHHQDDGGLRLQLQLEAADAQGVRQYLHQRGAHLVLPQERLIAHLFAQLRDGPGRRGRAGVRQYQRVLQLLIELLVLAGELGEEAAHLPPGLLQALFYLVKKTHYASTPSICLPAVSRSSSITLETPFSCMVTP